MTGYIKPLYVYDTQDGRNLDRTQGGLGVGLGEGVGGSIRDLFAYSSKEIDDLGGGGKPNVWRGTGQELDRNSSS